LAAAAAIYEIHSGMWKDAWSKPASLQACEDFKMRALHCGRAEDTSDASMIQIILPSDSVRRVAFAAAVWHSPLLVAANGCEWPCYLDLHRTFPKATLCLPS
jgi:hypothetical protein